VNDYLQLAIGGLILAVVFYSVWRNGRNNPESTGQLARRIKKMEETCAAIDPRIKAVEESVDRLARSTATTGDITALRAEIVADREVNERTWGAVSRLQDFFIDKAINGGRR
jgi:hypothetical protein